jgi:hypothetical protein
MRNVALGLVLVCTLTRSAWAEDEPNVTEARALFVKGAGLVKQARWAEALIAFEQANKLHAHAVTTYNIASCELAVGRYTLARDAFALALEQNTTSGSTELSDVTTADAKAQLAEVDGLLATVTVTLDPPNARIAIDGRPLAVRDGTSTPPVLIAGVAAPGSGEPPPAATFRVRVDPGAHVITLVRPGYNDAVVNRTFAPGASVTLPLKLDQLPAVFRIASVPGQAVVTVGGADVGLTPVEVSRPAGAYNIVIKREGFVTYNTQVLARAGEQLDLSPRLPVQTKPLTQRWWFWTAIGVVVVGAAVGTYFGVLASTAVRPPPNGGSLGWTVQTP